MSCCIEQRS